MRKFLHQTEGVMLHPCPECGKETDRKRCRSCAFQDGIARRKAGLARLNDSYTCADCGKKIVFGSSRCNSCERSRRWQDREERQKMVDGIIRTHPLTANRNCKDCGKKVSPGSPRCSRCSLIYKWNHTDMREKISMSNWLAARMNGNLITTRTNNPWFQRGEKHPRYKGNPKLRDTAQYDEWRDYCLKRDKYRCTKCDSRKYLQVHHIESWSSCVEKRHDKDNGITLCLECHRKEHPHHIPKPMRKRDRLRRTAKKAKMNARTQDIPL